VNVLFARRSIASHDSAEPPVPAAGLAELQAALGEGGLEDAQEAGLAPRQLGLATVLEDALQRHVHERRGDCDARPAHAPNHR
jgi:hypothetical protein